MKRREEVKAIGPDSRGLGRESHVPSHFIDYNFKDI